MARIITITSGKGGVGKTSISLNLALSLASKGYKVCLFDADLGLANVNILTGIYPKKDLADVISGQFSLNEIIIRDFQGVDIIPGSSGVEQMADLTATQTGTLISAFLDLEYYDFFIFDTSAGISPQVISFCMASHEIVLVATCEPTSLTDAYSMLKVLSKHNYKCPVKVIINRVRQGKTAQKAYMKLKDTVKRFLTLKLEPLGIIASDSNVKAAVIAQTPFLMLFPDSIGSRCINSIADKIIYKPSKYGTMPLELFWDNCMSFLKKHAGPVSEVQSEPDTPAPGQSETAEKESGLPQSRAGEETEKTIDSSTPEIRDILARIDSRLSVLVEEVESIKEHLKQKNSLKKIPEESQPIPAEKKPEKISLDFEEWLGKKYGL